jgi:hypothetical protein
VIDLPTLKEYLKRQVDAASIRAMPKSHPNHSTKLEEARDVIDALSEPASADGIRALTPEKILEHYPLLGACLGVDGSSLEEVARNVHKKSMNGRSLITILENTRQRGNKAIDEATTKEQCEAAYLAIKWPMGTNV